MSTECKRASNTRSSSPGRHKEINKEDDAFNCYLVVGWNGEFNKPKKEEVIRRQYRHLRINRRLVGEFAGSIVQSKEDCEDASEAESPLVQVVIQKRQDRARGDKRKQILI